MGHFGLPRRRSKVQYASQNASTKLVIVGKQKQGMGFALPSLDKANWAIYTLGKDNS